MFEAVAALILLAPLAAAATLLLAAGPWTNGARTLEDKYLATAIGAQWEVVHQSLQRSAAAPGSDLEHRLVELIQWWGARVLEDEQLRRKLDTWIADSAERLAEQWDDEVIGLIETTVERWDASEISHRLELQLGRDLQFVRINGTVVGALVGGFISSAVFGTASGSLTPQSQAEFIGEQAWTVYGDVIVEIERGDGLDTEEIVHQLEDWQRRGIGTAAAAWFWTCGCRASTVW